MGLEEMADVGIGGELDIGENNISIHALISSEASTTLKIIGNKASTTLKIIGTMKK